MKKYIFLFNIFVFSFLSTSFSQSGWVKVTDSIPNLVIMCIQFTSPLKGFACGSYNTVCPGVFLRTTNGGTNWIVTQFPEYSADDLSFLNDNTGYISAWREPGKSYILKTTNGGVNWVKLDSNYASFFKIKFYDYNNGMVVSKYNANHRTTDGGNSWINRDNALWSEPNSLICLNSNTWLVADKGPSINKTTNGGLNWELTSSYPTVMNCVSMYFINSTTGFSVDYFSKVFKTTDEGNNWFKIDSISGVYNFNNACITFPDYPIGYISNGRYVYKTTDGGFNWNRNTVNSNFSGYSMYFINVNTGFVGGSNGLIYRTTTGSAIGINQTPNEIPDNFSLYQNYPNPFNPKTIIKFQIKDSRFVTLRVYDILGREIATLVNEKMNAGTYEVPFSINQFSNFQLQSGVYFYKLVAGDYNEVKKMIFIK